MSLSEWRAYVTCHPRSFDKRPRSLGSYSVSLILKCTSSAHTLRSLKSGRVTHWAVLRGFMVTSSFLSVT